MIRVVASRAREAINSLAAMIDRKERYQKIFDNKDGQWVLRDLGSRMFLTKPTFVPGDPHQSALNEGKRLAMLEILRYIRTDKSALIQQIEETIDHENP